MSSRARGMRWPSPGACRTTSSSRCRTRSPTSARPSWTSARGRGRVEPPDGDFLDLDWLTGRDRGAPLVVILHGLEGSSRSHYASGLLRELELVGWRGGVVNFRSCSGGGNRCRRMCHSGGTVKREVV